MEMGVVREGMGIDNSKSECPKKLCGPAATVKAEKAAHNIRPS